jgi:hypothetical protein
MPEEDVQAVRLVALALGWDWELNAHVERGAEVEMMDGTKYVLTPNRTHYTLRLKRPDGSHNVTVDGYDKNEVLAKAMDEMARNA